MLHQIPTPKRSWCPPGWPQPRAKPPSQTSIPSTSSGGSSQEGSGWWQLQPKPQIPAKHGEKKTKKKREKKRKSLSSSKERLPELQSWNFGGRRLEMPDVAPWEGPAATEHRKIPLFVSEKSTFLPYHRNNSPVLGGFCKSQGLAEIWGGFNPDLGAHGCISSPGENPIFPQSCSHGVAPPSPL